MFRIPYYVPKHIKTLAKWVLPMLVALVMASILTKVGLSNPDPFITLWWEIV
jgi:hypothetical protein